MANRGEWQTSQADGVCAGCGGPYQAHGAVAVDLWSGRTYCETCGRREERAEWWDGHPGDPE